jgi:hypothetical protein
VASFSVLLYENPVFSTSQLIGDWTPYFQSSWRHSIRSIGGCWLAEGDMLHAPPALKETTFATALGKRLKIAAGGITYWDGQITEMELTKGGRTITRSMQPMANKVRAIYSKVGDNLLANPDVEDGAWATIGTPATIETVTGTWWARGTTAMHCVSDAASEGMMIESGVAITASRAYTASVTVNVVSGAWILQVVNNGGSTVVAQRQTGGTGREWLSCQIPDSNTVTSVDVRLISVAAGAECYADAAMLRLSAVRAETSWSSTAASAAAYGTIEEVLLEREMTDDEAAGRVARYLGGHAWPITRGSDQGRTRLDASSEMQLVIGCNGLGWSLAWVYSLINGTQYASTHISSALDEWQFSSSAKKMLTANATDVTVDGNTAPMTAWEVIEKATLAGDSSGNYWDFMVLPDFRVVYKARTTTATYHYSNGVLSDLAGAPIIPLQAMPGIIYRRDMPLILEPGGATSSKDPRNEYASEMWFIADDEGQYNEWSHVEDGRQEEYD